MWKFDLKNKDRLLLFAWLAVIYIAGLFIPLMDNDAAHHACIALRMHLTRDYVNLIDHGQDYLDKPHLHFWLSALSFKVFGVNSFAYKFPSFLFTLLAIYATYQLGKAIYTKRIGEFAALILSTSFAFTLANNDVRMDAILTGSITFTTWQLYLLAHSKNAIHLIGAGMGLAMGFATKGMIGVFTPGVAFICCLLPQQKWRKSFHWRWLLLPLVWLLFSSPILWAYYLQFDLHPEKTIRGISAQSGVKFILWSQNLERLDGASFGNSEAEDPFFYLHTMLWAFIPWSLLAYYALVDITRKAKRNPSGEYLLLGTVITLLLVLSFSSFKLPHYLNILFPLLAILTAAFLDHTTHSTFSISLIQRSQIAVISFILLFLGIVTVWIFPVKSLFPYAIFALFLFTYLRNFKSILSSAQICYTTLGVGLLVNLIFNVHIYPTLLQYQAGKSLAQYAHDHNFIDKLAYLENEPRSNSLDFYAKRIVPEISMAEFTLQSSTILIISDTGLATLDFNHIPYQIITRQEQYRVSTPKGKFLNPKTRKTTLRHYYLVGFSK